MADLSELPTTDSKSKKQDAASTTSLPCLHDALCGGSTRNVILHGAICTCSFGKRLAPVRDDYRHTPGIGSHKLHTRSARWNQARRICNEEGGHLAIVNSIAEAQVSLLFTPGLCNSNECENRDTKQEAEGSQRHVVGASLKCLLSREKVLRICLFLLNYIARLRHR